jgi:hypothetical protein
MLLAPAACALDFDRFDPSAQSAHPDGSSTGPTDGRTDAMGETATEEGGATSDDAAPEDAAAGSDVGVPGPDASPPADAAPDAPACVPPNSCLTSATGCGMNCTMQSQQCMSQCRTNSCRQGCTRTAQTCTGQCASTCMSCARNGGCSDATTACNNAVAGR